MFYFYEQGLLCDFLIPEIINKKNLKMEKNSIFISNSEKIDNNKINESKTYNKDNNKLNIPRNSNIFDISDKTNTFFEFKSNMNKPLSLISSQTIKKKNNPAKKTVGFTMKNKKGGAHKKNSLSYSNFLNK